jgi:hypothetical protein
MNKLNEQISRMSEIMDITEGKKDACYYKVKSRYKVWPSAYASGALVKCRKVGAANWGTKSEGEHEEPNVEEDDVEEAKKTDYSKEKSQGLHGWFSRKGGGGSKGWVDCNTCRKNASGTKTCKACGREPGEDRKYPACRPTPASCGTPKKGEKWGKKSNESLNEGLSDILYHFTYFGSLINILKQNEFHASTNIGSSADLNTSAGKFFFFSATRSRGAEGAGAGFGRRSVKLVLDGRKLGQRYKGFPIDYWNYSTKQSDWGNVNDYVASMKNQELEDRIVLDSPTIPDAASYILEIHVLVGKRSEVRKDELDRLMGYVKQYSIPIYFYADAKYYFNQVKDKAVDPYSVYGFTDEEPYVSSSSSDKLRGVDRVLYLLMYNDAGNKSRILDFFKFDEDEMDRFESGYQKDLYNYLIPNAVYDYEYYSVISSEVHNMRSNTEPKYKFVMKMLADDLRKYKVKNLKEYVMIKTKVKLNEQLSKMRVMMLLNEQSNPLQYGIPYEDIKKIIKGYIDCALWTEEETLRDEYVGDDDMFNGEEDDDEIERLSRLSANLNSKNFDSFTREDMEDNSVIKVYEDVKKFVEMATSAVRVAVDEHGAEQVGHDLWLSRNGHGAGFFDRGYDDEVEEMLMSSAKKLGGVDLYINDNVKLSFSNESSY